MKKEIKTRRFINLLAFVSIVFAAIALMLDYIFNANNIIGDVSSILSRIAYALAFVVAGLYAFSYVKSKGTACVIIYIVACVVLAVFLILPMFR